MTLTQQQIDEEDRWEQTAINGILHDIKTGKYHFIDETENVFPVGFTWMRAAIQAELEYARNL